MRAKHVHHNYAIDMISSECYDLKRQWNKEILLIQLKHTKSYSIIAMAAMWREGEILKKFGKILRTSSVTKLDKI